MVRSLLIEEGIEKSINELVEVQKQQVGLIIGQFSENKDFALHFVRCPDPVDDEAEIEVSDDEGEVTKPNKLPKKKISKTGTEDDIDSKWIVEHARQVSRMLTGGMSVLGVYIFCTGDALSKNQTKLGVCVQSVHKKIERNKWIRRSLPHNDRYLLHICAASKKITCRTIDLSNDQMILKPGDSRYQRFLGNWHYVSCCIDVNVKFHVPLSQDVSRTDTKIFNACQGELEDIWNAFATVNSKLVEEDKAIVDNSKSKKGKSEGGEIKINLFKQGNSSKKRESIKCEKSSVSVKFVGSICSKAYLNSKATFGEAVKAAKLDIIRSLITRIDLLCEEADVNNLCHVNEWSLVSPTRVFAPFKRDAIYFCDYVFKDESDEDTINRFFELLNISPKKSELIFPERSPDLSDVSMILHGEKFSDHQSDAASELSSTSCHEEPRNNKVIAALCAGVVAMFAAAVHLIWNE